MTVDDKIKDEKLKCKIKREATKIIAFSSGKFNEYEYFRGEERLLSDQSRITKQAKFTSSPLEKAFEKPIKTIKDQGIKQVEALKVLKPE